MLDAAAKSAFTAYSDTKQSRTSPAIYPKYFDIDLTVKNNIEE